MDTATLIAPQRLVELRVEGRGKASRFVDPVVLMKCRKVLARRGEAWAAEILGRSLARRSQLVVGLPYLMDGEEYTLVAADREESEARFAQIVADNMEPPAAPGESVGD
jgi:hypothetical protein